MEKYVIFVSLLLVGVSITSVGAIYCYQCNSNSDTNCVEGSKLSSQYVECLPGLDRCMRSRGPGNYVVRSCASSQSGMDCSQKDLGGGIVETCICNSNYCNGSERTKTNSVFFFSILITLLTKFL